MQDAGLGVQLAMRPTQLSSWRAWIWNLFRPNQDIVLAEFPLSTAITTKFITSQPGSAHLPSEAFARALQDDLAFLQNNIAMSEPKNDQSSWRAGCGPIYRELLESGACDERLLTMLFLAVEKLRGEVYIPTCPHCW